MSACFSTLFDLSITEEVVCQELDYRADPGYIAPDHFSIESAFCTASVSDPDFDDLGHENLVPLVRKLVHRRGK